MKIAYCTNVRLPSERAHGRQVAQVCTALSQIGHDVTIFAPLRRNVITEDFWAYTGAPRSVKITHLGSFDPIAIWWLPGVLKLWMLNVMLQSALRHALLGGGFDLLYTRTPALLPALLQTGAPVLLELHQLPRWGRRKFVSRCNQCVLVACLTGPMREMLLRWGVSAERVIVEGDAVDLQRFVAMPEMTEARRHFHIPEDRFVTGYVGRLKTLGMEKGVGELLQAISALRGLFFVFIVGGPETDRREYEMLARSLDLGADDVLFTGDIPVAQIPTALAACDVLAMPFPDLPHYRLHMSPLKMFEYMAAQRPIITTDLPTVRDVLSEDTAIFCTPGSRESLAEAIRWVMQHPAEAASRASRARALVTNHTWRTRMERILVAAQLHV